MLTQRGQAFLATLTRRPAVATREVADILAEVGIVNSVWLDFHDRYAGHVLELGRDVAVLGLVFPAAAWLDPYKPRLHRGPGTQAIWGIACADAHPAHEYALKLDGQFKGGPTESFDVFIEQSACIWSFTTDGDARVSPISQIQDQDFRARVLERAGLQPVPEASDRFTRVLMSERYLVFDDPNDDRLIDAWERRLS